MWETLLDLTLPLSCPGCGAPQRWCERCAGELAGRPRLVVPAAAGEGPALPPAYALALYRGPVRAAILAAKEHGRRDLPALLAKSLAAGLLTLLRISALSVPLWLVPAPTRPAAARRRGGDPVAVLSRAAAEIVAGRGYDVGVAPCLYTAGRAADSVGLDAAQRQSNLAGRVRWRARAGPPPGVAVVLIDDVLTSGTTAVAASAALVSKLSKAATSLLRATSWRRRTHC